MFMMLQGTTHQARTAFGDSDTQFGGDEVIPMHGIYQGNGSGPAIWMGVSTPVVNMLREANVGRFFSTPITRINIRFSGFSFADDIDTIQTVRNKKETWTPLAEWLGSESKLSQVMWVQFPPTLYW
jgi:hypothetical protein